MYHHLLCEGHTLLRSQLLLGSASQAQDVASSLRGNCLAMAESLCHYHTGKKYISTAARYLILSQQPVWDVVQTISAKFPRVSAT